ncbi:MAG: gamma-glutamyl-gamma-aminobutyrate hydrolase family protein [Pseudomonadota bacterium]
MKIGILETGFVPEDLQDTHKSYPAMFQNMLLALDPSLQFQVWPVLENDFPGAVTDADAWIVTGSKHGVYENLPWMIRLQVLLRDIVRTGVPVFGVCFGHQIMAEALGGKVVKSDKGWGIGVHQYDITPQTPAWLGAAPSSIRLHAFHQDQVILLPEGAQVWASSEFCPYAALQYGDTAASIQPHPEFSRSYETALLDTRRGTVIPEEIATPAEKSLELPVDSGLFGQWMLDFLRQTHKRKAA